MDMQNTMYLTIRQCARRGPLPEHALRQLKARGRLPGVYSGTRYYVNYFKLLEQLDRESEIKRDC